jgi:hypothetical protein
MSVQDPIAEIADPKDRPATQLSDAKLTITPSSTHFLPVDLVPGLLLRSHDFYRDFGWRGS